MKLILIWRGTRIPNTKGTHDAIKALGLDRDSTERLWMVWTAADALSDDDDVADLFDAYDPTESLACYIENPNFMDTACALDEDELVGDGSKVSGANLNLSLREWS